MADLFRFAGMAFWARAVSWSLVFGLIIGIPTVMVNNGFFSRMTAPTWWGYVTWLVVSALGGLVMALRKTTEACPVEGNATAGGGLAYLAVGCPICNKIVVGMIGTSGALSFFAPLQPLLGALAVGVLVWSLKKQLGLAVRGSSRLTPGP